MAARRLLIVMLVLLGLSTLAAALIPPREPSEETTTDATETAPTATETAPAGEIVPFAVPIDPKRISVVPVSAGDQLELAICSNKPDQVEIPAFGLLETVGPEEPATFPLLVQKPGTYGVRLVTADRVVVRIQVSKAAGGDAKRDQARKVTGRQRRCAALAGLPTGD